MFKESLVEKFKGVWLLLALTAIIPFFGDRLWDSVAEEDLGKKIQFLNLVCNRLYGVDCTPTSLSWVVGLLSAGCLIGLAFIAKEIGLSWIRPSIQHFSHLNRRSLIVSFSGLKTPFVFDSGRWLEKANPTSDSWNASLTAIVSANLKDSGCKNYNFQQPLRSLSRHLSMGNDKIISIVAWVPSGEDAVDFVKKLNSARDFMLDIVKRSDDFKGQNFRIFLTNGIEFLEGINPEHEESFLANLVPPYDLVPAVEVIERVTEILKKDFDLKHSEMLIDVTGGTKVLTIASVIVTMDKKELAAMYIPDFQGVDAIRYFDIETKVLKQ